MKYSKKELRFKPTQEELDKFEVIELTNEEHEAKMCEFDYNGSFYLADRWELKLPEGVVGGNMKEKKLWVVRGK